MKAISLWQPWGSGIVLGAKGIETRSWATKYRGPLLIHASKRYAFEQTMLGNQGNWLGALDRAPKSGLECHELLPAGALLGIVDLVGCQMSNWIKATQDLHLPRWRSWDRPMFPEVGHAELDRRQHQWCEFEMGDFTDGRYGWILENIRRFETPIPFKGSQGLFEVPDSVLASIKLIEVPLCGQEAFMEAA